MVIISGIAKKSSISFAAGNTKFFSDFRGTSMPFPEKEIIDPKNTKYDACFSEMSSKFKNFFQKAGDKVQLIITTGNKKTDFDAFLSGIAKKGLKFFMPVKSKLITTYGGDTFERVSPKEFIISQEKIKQVEQDSGWVKSEVVKDLKTILAKVSPETTVLNGGDTKALREVIFEQKKDNYASWSDDESNFSVSLKFPIKTETDNLVKTLRKHFNEETNMKVKVETRLDDESLFAYSEKGDLEFCEAKTVRLHPQVEDGVPLTKLYDPKLQVKKNISTKNNDLVIVAGNGPEDGAMLNPFEYLDESQRKKVKVIAIDDYKKYLEDEEICRQLKEMPLVSIVAGDDSALDLVREVGKMLDEKGIHKIITVDNPQDNLLNAVRQGMRNYAQENESYKNNLGKELAQDIFEKDDSPHENFAIKIIHHITDFISEHASF